MALEPIFVVQRCEDFGWVARYYSDSGGHWSGFGVTRDLARKDLVRRMVEDGEDGVQAELLAESEVHDREASEVHVCLREDYSEISVRHSGKVVCFEDLVFDEKCISEFRRWANDPVRTHPAGGKS